MWFGKDPQITEGVRHRLLNKIRPVIAEELKIDPERVVPEANIVDDLGADSLDVIEITMGLEEAFDIEILDEDIDKMKTVEDVIAYLAERAKT